MTVELPEASAPPSLHRHLLHVDDVIIETADAITIVFAKPDDPSFYYAPGQFLTLEIPHPDQKSVARCYSLSSSPVTASRPAVSVKRTPGGFASNWLCDNVSIGTAITALRPAGTFVPARWDRPLVLMAAGSGITPVMSILETALASHHDVVHLVYANANAENVMFASRLATLSQRYPQRFTVQHWLESDSQLPTEAGLRGLLPAAVAGADAYLCGPRPFMDLAHLALVASGMTEENVHREAFSSLASNPFLSATPVPTEGSADLGVPVSAEIEGDDHSFHCPPGTLLLDAMLARGIDAPFVCREGSCGACAFRLIEGEVEMQANDTLDDYELDRGMRLACQSIPVSAGLKIVID